MCNAATPIHLPQDRECRPGPIVLLLLLFGCVLATPAAASPSCKGNDYFVQTPSGGAHWSQDDPCQGTFIQHAETFMGDGLPVSGFRWTGMYQHLPGQTAPAASAFVVQIFSSPGILIDESFITDFTEDRQPESDGLTPMSACGYLDTFFETDPGTEYLVSIFAVLCSQDAWTTQWHWVDSAEGDGSAWRYAPVFGDEAWETIDSDLSITVFHPEAGIDITETNPAWMPEEDNTTTYTSKIYWREPRSESCIFPGPEKTIRFRLLDTSHERGICINEGFREHTDLHFNHPDNGGFVVTGSTPGSCDLFQGPHDHWNNMVTTTCVTEATITLWSEDWGAYGLIEASAEGCDPIEVVGLLPREFGGGTSCALGPPTVKVPYDTNGNDIADIWIDDAFVNADPTWDQELLPNPNSAFPGDGLSRYEEYRGAYFRLVNGTTEHTRLSTSRREIAIYRENTAFQAEDILASADVIDVTANGMNGADHDDHVGTVNPARGPRVFNFNRESHSIKDQHGLWLSVSGGDGNRGNWGVVREANGTLGNTIGPPGVNGRVEVYVNNVNLACAATVRPRFRFGVGVRRGWVNWSSNGTARANGIIRDVIGHELGHGHGQFHHLSSIVGFTNAPNAAMNVLSAPFSGRVRSTSATTLPTCVMQYKFHTIDQALSFRWNALTGQYHTVDPDWTPTLVQSAVGYGATCTATNGQNCQRNAHIKD